MTDRNPGAAYPSPPPSSPASSSLQITYEKQSPMSSLPPEQYVPNRAAQSQSSHGTAADKDNTSLSLNVDFLKALTDKRTTRDGNPPKRRGPKPDSKPALTRRQELNRQAQRTHRERKELYIKALEDEVLRLKEIYSNTSQDKEKLADENRQLKALLAQNGITRGAGSAASPPSNLDDIMSSPSVGYSSNSGYGTAFTPPLTSQSTAPSVTSSGAYHHSPQARHGHSHSQSQGGYGQHQHQPQMGGQQMRALMQQQQHRGTDMDQAGIDFVLTLEKPCMDHLPWLLERSAESGSEACGHALMASCPPEPFTSLTNETPFGYSNVPQGNSMVTPSLTPISAGGGNMSAGGQSAGAARGAPAVEGQQRTWELSKADLATLLDLSKRLDLDGEITPIMAWGLILAHPRIEELKSEDFVALAEILKSKVRCYGFGAVLEEFEVRDAIENAFSTKPELMLNYKLEPMALAF